MERLQTENGREAEVNELERIIPAINGTDGVGGAGEGRTGGVGESGDEDVAD